MFYERISSYIGRTPFRQEGGPIDPRTPGELGLLMGGWPGREVR